MLTIHPQLGWQIDGLPLVIHCFKPLGLPIKLFSDSPLTGSASLIQEDQADRVGTRNERKAGHDVFYFVRAFA